MERKSPPKKIYRFDTYYLDSEQKLLFSDGSIIPLGQKSYECLLLLIENAGQVVLKETFFDEIWHESFVEDGVLAVNISYLRKSLGETKDKKYIETLPRKGYRFVAEVIVESIAASETLPKEEFPLNTQITQIPPLLETIDEDNSLPSSTVSENDTELEKDDDKLIKDTENDTGSAKNSETGKGFRLFSFSKIHLIEIILLLFVAIVAAFLLYQKYSNSPVPKVPRKVSVVIFPFENVSHNQELNYLSLSLADSLNYSLAPISHARVIPTSIIKRYVGQNYAPNEEARKLGAENAVTGNYHAENDKIFVNVEIIRLSTNNPFIQRQSFESSVPDLAHLRNSINKFIVAGLNLDRSDSELLEIQRQETQNPAAYESYLKGSNAYYNTQFDLAINYFQKAVDSDPNFIAALEELATSYLQKGSLTGCGAPCHQRSTEYFEKILQIAPHHERARLKLALSYIDSNQIDQSIPLIRTVLEKNPENKYAYFCLSYAYRYAGILDQSAKVIEQNQSADKTYTSFADIPITYLYQQDYEKFLQEADLFSTKPDVMFYKGFTYYHLKNYSEAKKFFDEAYKLSPDTLVVKIGKVYSYHLENNDTAARKLLDEIHSTIIKNQVGNGEIIYKTAQAFAELKHSKEALEMFSLSIEKGFFCYPYFKKDPLLDNIRNQKEFDVILQKAQQKHVEFKNKYLN